MLHARMSVTNIPNRPAILRKDFILSRYQVLESRIWGADSILLIVSMLSEALLRDLYQYSVELGMEPLVEVNNAKEMKENKNKDRRLTYGDRNNVLRSAPEDRQFQELHGVS